MLLREGGVEVRQQPMYDRGRYVSTRIREMMIKGDQSWRGLVPASVARIIDEVKGVERLRVIMSGEAEPHKW